MGSDIFSFDPIHSPEFQFPSISTLGPWCALSLLNLAPAYPYFILSYTHPSYSYSLRSVPNIVIPHTMSLQQPFSFPTTRFQANLSLHVETPHPTIDKWINWFVFASDPTTIGSLAPIQPEVSCQATSEADVARRCLDAVTSPT